MPTTHAIAAARWYAATQGDHFSAQAGDGQNELFLTPDNVLPPALLMWALVLTSFFCVLCDKREGGRAFSVGVLERSDGWMVCSLWWSRALSWRSWAAVALLFDLHRPASSALAQMRCPRLAVTIESGLFGQWLNSRHRRVTPLFSLPASDSFPKGQLEVQSSHTQCVWRVFQVKLQPFTPSPDSLLQRWLLKTWKYC